MIGTSGNRLAQPTELHVLGAEIVTPLADAVRLVDGEQGKAPVERAQSFDEAGRHERLGSDVQQVEVAGVQRAEHAARVVGLE